MWHVVSQQIRGCSTSYHQLRPLSQHLHCYWIEFEHHTREPHRQHGVITISEEVFLVTFTSHDCKQDLPRRTAWQSSLLINRLIWVSQATVSIIKGQFPHLEVFIKASCSILGFLNRHPETNNSSRLAHVPLGITLIILYLLKLSFSRKYDYLSYNRSTSHTIFLNVFICDLVTTDRHRRPRLKRR